MTSSVADPILSGFLSELVTLKHDLHDGNGRANPLAAHILDLYDIHARNCLPEDFPSRAVWNRCAGLPKS